jgi:hypothetical protein
MSGWDRRGLLARVWVVAASALCGVGAMPSSALASAPPTVRTGEAGSLSDSSTTLHGSIFPANQATSYYFEYGPTLAYGSQAQGAGPVSGTRTVFVSAPIAGLAPFTTYHYRLVASNSTGTAYGQDRTVTTRRVPLTFTLAPRASRVLAGRPFIVSGQLHGTGSAGHPIVLQANPFPYLAGFNDLGGAATTDVNGSFSLPVSGLTQSTQLRVAAPGLPLATSAVTVAQVAVRVTLHVRPVGRRGYLRLSGTVTPAEPGARVSFRLRRKGRALVNVGTTSTSLASATSSRFERVLRIRHAGLYDAYVQVSSGAQVSNGSRYVLIR